MPDPHGRWARPSPPRLVGCGPPTPCSRAGWDGRGGHRDGCSVFRPPSRSEAPRSTNRRRGSAQTRCRDGSIHLAGGGPEAPNAGCGRERNGEHDRCRPVLLGGHGAGRRGSLRGPVGTALRRPVRPRGVHQLLQRRDDRRRARPGGCDGDPVPRPPRPGPLWAGRDGYVVHLGGRRDPAEHGRRPLAGPGGRGGPPHGNAQAARLLGADGRHADRHDARPAGVRTDPPRRWRNLSAESAARMRTVSHDMGTPDVQTMGLGWPLMPFGRTTVLSISGASPGGVAVLAVCGARPRLCRLRQCRRRANAPRPGAARPAHGTPRPEDAPVRRGGRPRRRPRAAWRVPGRRRPGSPKRGTPSPIRSSAPSTRSATRPSTGRRTMRGSRRSPTGPCAGWRSGRGRARTTRGRRRMRPSPAWPPRLPARGPRRGTVWPRSPGRPPQAAGEARRIPPAGWGRPPDPRWTRTPRLPDFARGGPANPPRAPCRTGPAQGILGEGRAAGAGRPRGWRARWSPGGRDRAFRVRGREARHRVLPVGDVGALPKLDPCGRALPVRPYRAAPDHGPRLTRRAGGWRTMGTMARHLSQGPRSA